MSSPLDLEIPAPAVATGAAASEVPMSIGQRGLWFLDRLAPGGRAYHLAAAFRLHGEIDEAGIRAAFELLLARHEALRTVFPEVDGEPVARVEGTAALAFSRHDLPSGDEAALLAALAEAAYRPFDPTRGPLFRVDLFRRGAERFLVVSLHHLVADFTSLAQLLAGMREVWSGEAASASPAPPFSGFAAWQNDRLAGPEGEAQWEYWRGELAGLGEAPELPLGLARRKEGERRAGCLRAEWRGALPDGLAALGRKQGGTEFAALVAGFEALLARYTGADEVALGVPLAGRPAAFPGVDEIVGYFVNPVVLRGDLAADPPFGTLVATARRQIFRALRHGEMPLPRLLERLRRERGTDLQHPFRAMLVYHREVAGWEDLPSVALGEEGGRLALGGVTLETLPLAPRTAQLDLVVHVGRRRGGLGVALHFDRDVVDPVAAGRLLGHLKTLLAAGVADPAAPLSALPMLTAAERRQLLGEAPAAAAPALPLLHSGFEHQAAAAPWALALEAGEERLSYGELASRVHRLARHLAAAGVGPEVVVGVHLPRRAELIVALLAVAEAGGAYLPLDPSYPAERLAGMLADASARRMITDSTLPALPFAGPLLRLDEAGPAIAAESADPLPARVEPANLAYLIFTSGSTGRPKAVALTHGNAAELVAWGGQAYRRGELERVLASTSVAFDMSVFEIFATLAHGGTVVLVGSALDLPALPDGGDITLLNTVPAAAAALLELAPLPPSLRVVNLGGEPLRRALVEALRQAGAPPVVNLYGPSEDTTFSTAEWVAPGEGEPAIGRPVAGSRAYVLGRRGELLPAGVPGELFLGGPALARGYLGRPELTAARFVPDGTTGEAGRRLYATGDLVHRDADGTLHYHGRLDRQLKIRGYRVEPGEVEAALAAVPWVRDTAVVLAGEALAAFVTLAPEAPAGWPAALAGELSRRLPAPFLPTSYTALPALPLNPNGKIDRLALAARLPRAAAGEEAPRGPIEETLAALWGELLGIERVSRDSRFFELGGHSLLAARARARLAELFDAEPPLAALLAASTLAGWAEAIAATRGREREPPIPRRPAGVEIPASFAQARLWFLDRLRPGSTAYHLPLALDFAGPLDRGALASALAEIVRRHESLRTAFRAGGEGGVPWQEAVAARPVALPRIDLTRLDAAAGAEAERRLADLARRPFDLGDGELLHAALLELGPERHFLSVTVHHIAADGASLALFTGELAALYEALRAGRPSPLPELPVQVGDLALWQRRRLAAGGGEADLAFWRTALAGLADELPLPADRPRPTRLQGRAASLPLALGDEFSADLRASARAVGATPFMVLLAAWGAWLARVSGEEAPAVGVPWSGRDRPELAPLIACLVNTLPLRLDLAGDPSGAEMAARARGATLAAHAHAEMPFERLVEALAPGRESPFFRTLLAVAPEPPPPCLPGLAARAVALVPEEAKFDLLLEIGEVTGTFAGRLEIATDLFDRATGERIAGAFLRLLAGLVEEPSRPLSGLSLLSATERAELAGWNETAKPRPSGMTLPALLATQAERTPDAVAVEAEEGNLTYAGLARRAGGLARALIGRGVGPERIVAVALERSLDQVVAFVAIVAAGGAYLPLDPDDPPERRARLAAGATVVLDRPIPGGAAGDLAPPAGLLPEHPAYVIYTSGSTGAPKGVVNVHGAIVNRLLWMQEAFDLTAADRVLQKTPATFDVSVWEYFWPLLIGARLVLARPGGHRDPDYLAAVMAEREITHLHFVPSMLQAFLDRQGRAGSRPVFPSLRQVIASGEALSPDLAQRFFALLPDTPLANLYGPTEAAVDVTAWPVRQEDTEIPIGHPIANVHVHVHDRWGSPAAVGVPGEILLGGLGLARGYLDRPDLTAERFVPDPFSTSGERLYRTGDLGRRRADGALVYLGRIDGQIKVRGIRIEPGEVEAALTSLPAVTAAAVGTRGTGAAIRLVAWVVATQPLTSAEIRADLGQRLPSHLIPSQIVFLPELPQTSSGKLDRQALPDPAPEAATGEAPASPIEEAIATIFAEILGLPAVAATDSFFDQGGHSLLATLVLSRLEQAFPQTPLALRDLFEAPTPRALASRLEAAGGAPPEARSGGTNRRSSRPSHGDSERPPAGHLRPPGDESFGAGPVFPLSPAQERMWVLERLARDTSPYVIAGELRFTGPLSPAALQAANSEVVRRHEILRTAYPEVDGAPTQAVLPAERVPLPIIDLSALAADRAEGEGDRWSGALSRQRFDLTRSPVLRLALLRLQSELHRLVVAVHHIAADGWSLGVWAREVGALYRAALQGEPSPLAQLPVRPVSSAGSDGDLAWFVGRLRDIDPLALPGDRPRPVVATYQGGEVPVTLAGAAVRDLARQAGATPFMVLAAGFGAFLARLSGDERLALGTAVAGRDRPETEGLIGLFVNTVALAVEAPGRGSFGDLVARMREEVLEAFAHRALPFERLVEALAPDRSAAVPPGVQALFVLQNTPPMVLDLPGLTVEQREVPTGVARLDLTLALAERGDGLAGSLEYASDLFDRTTAMRWAAGWARFLEAALAAPEQPLAALDWLSEVELQQVAREWGPEAWQPGPAADGLLHRPFERQAAGAPDRVAVVFRQEAITYGELARRAAALAGELARRGLPSEGVVGVSLVRTPEAIVALLGILRAGGVWLPIDPALPEIRRRWLAADAGACLLVTRRAQAHDLGELPILWLDDGWAAAAGTAPPEIAPDQLAYIVHTSGSTGEPKGVAVPHRDAVHHLANAAGCFRPGPGDRLFQFHAFSFDPSVEQICLALGVGATLVLRGDELPEPGRLLQELRRLEITLTGLPTPYWLEWVKAMGAAGGPESKHDRLALRIVDVGGEAMPAEVARAWGATPAGGARLVNAYGPTEAVISSTAGEVPHGAAVPDPVPIGRPLPGRPAYVLSAEGFPQPPGVLGELHLGGALARGYVGRPGPTAERFRPDPFADVAGARLYATGDRVRFLPDGQLQYFGRLDRQVKIRGFRIEPGEIEAVLARHPAVRQTAVVVRPGPDGGLLLIAYVAAYVAAPETAPDTLRDFLATQLPAPLVPAVLAVLPELPHTAQGKVDRRALAVLPLPAATAAVAAPADEVERTVAAVFAGLLGRPEVGAEGDFFALGGHSLLAARAAGRLAAAFGVDVPLSDLFERPTVRALARWLAARLGGDAEIAPIPRLPAGATPPVSFAQARLWFLDRLSPGEAVYHMPAAVLLTGALSVPALAAALAGVEARHEVLRTVFPERAGAPLARLRPVPDPGGRLPVVDLAALPDGRRESEAEALARLWALLPFDLARGPVWRSALLRREPAEQTLLVTVHHIAADGWSIGILVREVAALYAGEMLPPLPLQYGDFAAWQREHLAGGRLAADLAHFRGRLAGAAPLELPADRPRPAARTARGDVWLEAAAAPLASRVGSLARSLGATPFMVLLAAFAGLLERLSGQGEATVGTAHAGRDRPETEELIGLFVNTLALRLDTAGDPPFATLVRRTRGEALAAFAHRELPFDRLVEELAPERTLAHAPLVQAVLALQNLPTPGFALPGLTLAFDEGLLHPPETAKFDLTLEVYEDREGYRLLLEWSRDLFERPTAARLAGAFVRLLEGALADPEARLSSLPLLSAVERQQAAVEWAGGGEEEGELATAAFFAWAERQPEAAAVLDAGGDRLATYGELAEQARALAATLSAAGVRPEAIVAVSMERGLAAIVALLGVLAAGGVYLPVDGELPAERRQGLLARAGFLLTGEAGWQVVRTGPGAAASGPPLLRRRRGAGAKAAALAAAPPAEARSAAPEVPLDPRSLAYLLFTSGSTGEPKGVAVAHAALAAHLAAIRREYGLGPGERVLQFASHAFDPALEQILGALGAGATLVLRGGEVPTPADFGALLAAAGVTVANLPTAYWEQWTRDGLPGLGSGAPLRLVLPGGEAMSAAAARRFIAGRAAAEGGPVALANVYGPTEAVITATRFRVPEQVPEPVPIGRPVAPHAAYVRAADGGLLPPLAVGELALGGPLARGYLGQPAETAARFVPDPFSGRPGARLYATGDRARLLPGGDIEFLGRADRQVKIRGFRVELGEVEAALLALPEVAAAAAWLAGRGEDGNLAAAVAPAAGTSPTAAALRETLRQRLPHYLVPASLHLLPVLPQTPTGKIDRQALAALRPAPALRAEDRPARLSSMEELVARAWAEALGRPVAGIGRGDRFFDLGGHSLLAARAAAHLSAALRRTVNVREIFEEPELEALAARLARGLRGGQGGGALPLGPVAREGPPPLSWAQSRLWFLDRMEPGNPAYNVPLSAEIHGPLSPGLLARVLTEIARRHEILRTRFPAMGGEPVAMVEPPAQVPLPGIDLGTLPAAARERELRRLLAAEAVRPFDLARGPVWRLALVALAPGRHALLASAHHIACDAASVRRVEAEMAELYAAWAAGKPSPLAPLPLQAADLGLWQRRWLAEGRLDAQLAYWRERLAGEVPVLALPADRPRPPLQSFRGDLEPVALPPPVAAGVLGLARRLGATPFMAWLAAFVALLGRLSGQRDLTVGLPIDGRHRAETLPLVGFLLNTVVLRADLAGSPGFAALVEQVRAVSLAAYAHQDLPFEKLVDELKPPRSLAHSPLFQALFALLHDEPGGAADPGWTLVPLAAPTRTAKLDLSLFVHLGEAGEARLAFEYATDLFDRPTVARFGEALGALLEAALADPVRPLFELAWLSPAAAHQLTAEWNDAPPPDPAAGQTAVHRLFERWARDEPGRPALLGDGWEVTYGQLDARAELLAARLGDLGLPPEAPVGALAGRGAALAVALLAIFKAGGAYLPLDPAYPAARLAFLLADAGAALVLVEAGVREALPESPAPVVELDARGLAVGGEVAKGACAAKLRPPVDLDRLSYLLYTSGSTGQPKGVAQTHRTLANLIGWQVAARPGAFRTLQFASPSFDVSVLELFATWAAGGVVVVPPEEVRTNPDRLAPFLADAGVERLFLPYVALQGLAERLAAAPRLPALSEIVTAGEQLQITPQIRALLKRLPGCRLANQYGPTEAHVVTELLLAGDPAGWPTLPSIGRSLPNLPSHVADAALALCPIGVPGELLLAGAGLARGYLGRPDATAERFIPDALTPAVSGIGGGRLYRTGDLTRRLPNGEIEYLGRLDRQVKVRGVRLELGEVEAALAACPGVAEAAAFVREVGPGDRRLGACVVAAPGATLDLMEIKRILATRLPEALIPSSIAPVPALPVLGSGKLDRAVLPALAASVEAEAPYTAPETAGEKAIAATVATVLGRERVGREDNFFDLGAHSLLMVRLASALGEALEREIPVVDLFRFPTVASLAAHLGSSEEEESAALKERFEQRADLRRRAAGRRRMGRGEG